MKIFTSRGKEKIGARLGAGHAAIKQTNHTTFTHWHALGVSHTTALGAVALAAGTIRALPFISPPFPIVIEDMMGIIVGTHASNAVRIAIYDNINTDASITMYPGVLVGQSAEMSTATAASITTSGINISLLPGRLYWSVVYSSTATATMRGPAVAGYPGGLGTTTLGTAPNIGWTATLAYAVGSSVCPPIFPSLGTVTTTAIHPTIFAKFA